MEFKNKIASGETVDVYKDGNNVIKVYKDGNLKSRALYEALTHSRVEETGLKIPVIHEVSVIDNQWAITMDCIEGKTLKELMDENPDKIDEYIEMFVDIQLEIHSKKMPKLSKLKDKLIRIINNLDCLDDVKRYELLTRLEGMPKHTKLCHCNYTPDNIIINDDGVYIVDWGKARQGNASADVGNTYLVFSLTAPEIAEKYLNLFCTKTKTSRKYVQDWLPIVAAARLTDNIPEEHDFLMKWVDVVAYE